MTKNLQEYFSTSGEMIPQQQVEEWLKFKKQVDEHNDYSQQVIIKMNTVLKNKGSFGEDK